MSTPAIGSESVTARARTWAATMDGFDALDDIVDDVAAGSDEGADLLRAAPSATAVPSVRRAHRDSGALVAPGAPLLREEREQREARLLAPGATRSEGAGDRRNHEAPDPVRTCFERDRDRIVHGATAFRRLAGKTQVFIFPDDHQRTRLTHALEVAQVATAVARALRLNVALTEAIALGHDCGHGPGGHASEDAFTPYLADGFDHAVWGADVVLAPLNLCAETLDGIRNHSWSRPAPTTPEGEVVSWADRIAYVCHDFEDAVAAGIVTPDALPALVRQRCGERRSHWLRSFIDGVIDATTATGAVAMDDARAEALAAFRATNYERIYLRPDSLIQSRAVVAVLQALVEHYASQPDRLAEARHRALGAKPSPSGPSSPSAREHPEHPSAPEPRGAAPGTAAALHDAVTYVAGMTDRYACRMAIDELSWPEGDLPRGLDERRR